jgi:hypothetical protein
MDADISSTYRLPVDDDARVLISCPATAVIWRERRCTTAIYAVAGSHVLP